ncbi:MAG: hypothetical protein LBT27_04310 [Prevotellaceae bacterium]|nr:hypothetical protein [Prevotellaceae bacterium]
MFTLVGAFCLPALLSAQTISGPDEENQLKISVYSETLKGEENTSFIIKKFSVAANRWINQIYESRAELFSIRIGNMFFTTSKTLNKTATLLHKQRSYITGAEKDDQQSITAVFDGRYTSVADSFFVTWNISYNKTNPDYVILSVTVDASRIPVGTPIYLGVDFDAYVNGCDGGAAYILPNIDNNNGRGGVVDTGRVVELTTDQMKTLRLVATRNARGTGKLLGVFTMSQPFVRGYSDIFGWLRHVKITIDPWRSTFRFGDYSAISCKGNGVWDSALGVAYELEAGEETTVTTGLTFTSDILSELDYVWLDAVGNEYKNLKVKQGDNIALKLKALSYSNVNNIQFKVNMHGLKMQGNCLEQGFKQGLGTFACQQGNDVYEVSGAGMAELDVANITIPLTVPQQCGQWTINGGSITNVRNILPLGAAAVLTAESEINFASGGNKTISPGSDVKITVKLPDGITALENVRVNVRYVGNTGVYTSLPDFVIIPAGANSTDLTIKSDASISEKDLLTITLTKTDKTYVTLGANKTINVVAQSMQANDDYISVFDCKSLTADVLANDFIPNGANATLSLVSNPKKGKVEINNSKLIYTNTSCSGATIDEFTYQICDANNCRKAAVRVNVLRLPQITLKEECSFMPVLMLDFQSAGAVYEWQYRSGATGSVWTKVADNNNELKTINQGEYRVKISYLGQEVFTTEKKLKITEQTTINQINETLYRIQLN